MGTTLVTNPRAWLVIGAGAGLLVFTCVIIWGFRRLFWGVPSLTFEYSVPSQYQARALTSVQQAARSLPEYLGLTGDQTLRYSGGSFLLGQRFHIFAGSTQRYAKKSSVIKKQAKLLKEVFKAERIPYQRERLVWSKYKRVFFFGLRETMQQGGYEYSPEEVQTLLPDHIDVVVKVAHIRSYRAQGSSYEEPMMILGSRESSSVKAMKQLGRQFNQEFVPVYRKTFFAWWASTIKM